MEVIELQTLSVETNASRAAGRSVSGPVRKSNRFRLIGEQADKEAVMQWASYTCLVGVTLNR